MGIGTGMMTPDGDIGDDLHGNGHGALRVPPFQRTTRGHDRVVVRRDDRVATQPDRALACRPWLVSRLDEWDRWYDPTTGRQAC